MQELQWQLDPNLLKSKAFKLRVQSLNLLDVLICTGSLFYRGPTTVPLKCKLTVSTGNSILDPRSFRESRIEFRGSSFEFLFLRFENQVSNLDSSLDPRSFRESRIEFRVSSFESLSTYIWAVLYIGKRAMKEFVIVARLFQINAPTT